MTRPFSELELEAYLDESLAPQEMLAIETAVHAQPQLQQRLFAINQRRDAGVHSVGEIWRRQRLSCPTRENLGSYLLGALPDDHLDYVRFHLETVGCSICLANLADLDQKKQRSDSETHKRGNTIFQSSVGRLRGENP